MTNSIFAVKTTENLHQEYIDAGVEPFTVLNVFKNECGKLRLCSDNGPVFVDYTEELAEKESKRFAEESVKRGYVGVKLVKILNKSHNEVDVIMSGDVPHRLLDSYDVKNPQGMFTSIK